MKKIKVYIAGHNGMVGSAILRLMINSGFNNIITATKEELDLINQESVLKFLKKTKPECIIIAAAKVGGIIANSNYPAQFLYENLQIQNNLIHSAFLTGVDKVVFLGSSCIYPRNCPQPMKEEYLLTGLLEPTNEGYAIAKIAGLKMIDYYNKQYGTEWISLMPCNLYGPNDCFDLKNAHVLSSLIKKFVDAINSKDETVTLFGTGIARREFMHVDDAAKAILFMIDKPSSSFINIGWGEDISIKDLAFLIADKLNFKGCIRWDDSKPDGMLQKCLDVSLMKSLGFSPEIILEKGIDFMIKYYNNIITKTK